MMLMVITISINLYDQQSVRFAVIGDYGSNYQAELDVANSLKNWNPEFIITTGGNNYNNYNNGTVGT
jgi:hypothetical protein